ncbi:MAG: outer membrane beta-barrel protein [Candidatus Solibacter usitatus]|nr:outer membrane beta-barrel protein [Candidatus Solibacter usitatus]
MKRILFTLLLSIPLPAQVINWGVKGGIPLNDAVEAAGAFKPVQHRWTFGPVIEFNLPAGLGLEAEALYRRVGYQTEPAAAPGTGRPVNSIFNSNAWSFPILAKYKFPGDLARLYVSGGFVFRTLSDVPNLWDSSTKGWVLGAGIRYNTKLIKISPELRYTRWGTDHFQVNASHGNSLNSKLNQVEFLVGITF